MSDHWEKHLQNIKDGRLLTAFQQDQVCRRAMLAEQEVKRLNEKLHNIESHLRVMGHYLADQFFPKEGE